MPKNAFSRGNFPVILTLLVRIGNDFLTFITGTHVLDDGTISFLLENFLEHQMSSEILTPLRVVVLQYWDQTNFSADGTKAFKIGSNVLNLVFDDESVIVIVKFGLVSHIL